MSTLTHTQLSFKVAGPDPVQEPAFPIFIPAPIHLPDGIHPYDHEIDNFVIIHHGQEAAWARTKGTAQRLYAEMLYYEAEHQRRKSWDPHDIGLEARDERSLL